MRLRAGPERSRCLPGSGSVQPPPGSLEGLIYTTMPLSAQVRGYLEIVTQVILLSALLFYRVRHPGKLWLNSVQGVAYALCVIVPIVGMLAPRR
ncbi:MAG TPA: hypothetical protein VFO44_11600 [Steroidobacteraceae bacterium]|nr:hypothetical protein [Steroidobacteraceae bacterium]